MSWKSHMSLMVQNAILKTSSLYVNSHGLETRRSKISFSHAYFLLSQCNRTKFDFYIQLLWFATTSFCFPIIHGLKIQQRLQNGCKLWTHLGYLWFHLQSQRRRCQQGHHLYCNDKYVTRLFHLVPNDYNICLRSKHNKLHIWGNSNYTKK